MISIIIPTLNEADTLAHTIKHTLDVATKPELIEIIVIDSGSVDGTLENIQSLNLNTYTKPEFIFNKHLSLNFGAGQASYGTLLFLDADTLKEWLEEHLNFLFKNLTSSFGSFLSSIGSGIDLGRFFMVTRRYG